MAGSEPVKPWPVAQAQAEMAAEGIAEQREMDGGDIGLLERGIAGGGEG